MVLDRVLIRTRRSFNFVVKHQAEICSSSQHPSPTGERGSLQTSTRTLSAVFELEEEGPQ